MQNPTLSLEDNAAVTQRVIDDLDGPVVLVGHSYGGAVITEAGLHEKVAALGFPPIPRCGPGIAGSIPDRTTGPTGRLIAGCLFKQVVSSGGQG